MAKRALRISPGLVVVAAISALLLGPIASSLDINHYFSSGQAFRYIRDNVNVLSLKPTRYLAFLKTFQSFAPLMVLYGP